MLPPPAEKELKVGGVFWWWSLIRVVLIKKPLAVGIQSYTNYIRMKKRMVLRAVNDSL